jgi:type IV secretion system protein VirD4
MAVGNRSEPDYDPVMVGVAAGVIAAMAALALFAVEWPLLVWSSLRGRPTLIEPFTAIGGAARWLLIDRHGVPHAWAGVAPVLPPRLGWFVLDGMLALAVLAGLVAVWLRLDRWSGRSTLGLASWDLRRKVRPRSWAVPRDWLHLQPRIASRSGPVRRAVNRVMRPLVGERRAPALVGGDGWNLGRLRRAEVRSGRECHELVVAPTRSGKTRRVVATEAIEHDGPAVILSNKVDVLGITYAAREARGPVWIYAPLSDRVRRCASWSPLVGCERRERALLMAQWIFDADPTASAASEGSGGARFYNREAVELLLPALLQAAALSGQRMADVLGWLRGGVDALDRPREILSGDHDSGMLAWQSAEALAGVQALDERPRSLLLMSAAQLLGAYRIPAVQAVDDRGFDVGELLRHNGTLYLIAPEDQTEVLAPIFGGILGEVLRACEQRAQQVADPRRLPLVKVLADEAAHLTPLRKLPTYLSVSAGWEVRWCLIYQSLAQVRHRYGSEADAVLANTLSKLVLGPIHDRSTREEIVALLGYESVEQTSHTSDRWGGTRSTTRQRQQRPVISAEQLARIGEGEAVAIHGRDLPAIVRLPFYDEWPLPLIPSRRLDRKGDRSA